MVSGSSDGLISLPNGSFHRIGRPRKVESPEHPQKPVVQFLIKKTGPYQGELSADNLSDFSFGIQAKGTQVS